MLVPANTFQLVRFAAPIVKISGAVSPAARAMASRQPLMIPGAAFGSTTVSVVRLVLAAERVAGVAQVLRHQPQHLLGWIARRSAASGRPAPARR